MKNVTVRTLSLLVICAATVFLSACQFGPVHQKWTASLPGNALTSDQLRELFVDKTVKSQTRASGRISDTYYDPSGQVRQLQNGNQRYGHWKISDNGRICLKMAASREKCRIILQQNGEYGKYVVKRSGEHEHVVSYLSFENGNTLGF